jgi:hypothetical protein
MTKHISFNKYWYTFYLNKSIILIKYANPLLIRETNER